MLALYSPALLNEHFALGKGKKLFQDQERKIINCVFHENPTQKQVTDRTKIPQQTMSRMVNALMQKGVFQQVTRESQGSRGQPGVTLVCNPDYAYSLGVAILMDSVAIGIMAFDGQLLHSEQVHLGFMSVENVLNKVEEMFAHAQQNLTLDPDRCLGIGVGISGYFITDPYRVNTHQTLNAWAEVNIAEVFSKRFNLSVWLDNDATLAAAGEGILGVGKAYPNFAYLFISTAFGGGIISNRDLLRGTHGNAGEIGEMLPPKLFVHPNLENLRQILIKNDVDIETIQQMLENFDPNWPGVGEWIYKVKDSLSLVSSAAAAILDTQAIVIGGHIPKSLATLLLDEIEMYVGHRRHQSRPVPNLLVAEAQCEPVSAGAASLPFRELCL